MPEVVLLPDGPDIAVRALAEALARAYSNPILRGDEALYGESRVSASVSETLFWIAALDDHFQHAVPNYFAVRGADQGGRTVGGLIYVRNIVGHGLHTATAAEYDIAPLRRVEAQSAAEGGDRGSGPGGHVYPTAGRPLVSVAFRWAPLADLPAPRVPETHGRDRMYDDEVAGRPLLDPPKVAQVWLKGII